MIGRRLVLLALPLVLGGAATPPSWTVVRGESTLALEVRAFGSAQRGRFEDWRGDLTFDPARPADTRADVTVQTASLRMATGAATRQALTRDFLDAERYPTVRLQLRSLEPAGGVRHTARADVTIRGRTRPVSFPVDVRVEGGQARMTGAIVIERADFGIGTSGPWNGLIARQVTVRVALTARREG